ncbi:MAG: DUF5660 family protein [Candidatus Roizmanbacteria bacterium]
MNRSNSNQNTPPSAMSRQSFNPFESAPQSAPTRSLIPPRPRQGAILPDMGAYSAPANANEGGSHIPTFAEAQKAQEQQFFAARKAEFDSVLEKASRKELREIEQAKEVIKLEIKKLEKMNLQMNEKLNALHKIAMDGSEKKGIYYVRFMELMLEVLKTLGAKVSESNTWLEAMISKKKKRGSLFASQSKNHGTQYSMSQELSIARSTN